MSWLREALGKSVCLVFQFRKKKIMLALSLEKYELRETLDSALLYHGDMCEIDQIHLSLKVKTKRFQNQHFWLSLVVSQIL